MTTDISNAQKRLALIRSRHKEQLKILADVQGKKMAAYAKANYKWRAHTHNASNSIGSNCVWRDSSKLRLSLTSGVNYGIYLEYVNFRHRGRLSIFWPTLNRYKPELLRQWRMALGR